MSIRVITPPTQEPVTVAEARLHARIDDTAEDALLAAWITAARLQAEHRTQRTIAACTLELTLDAFPVAEIRLPRAPVSSVVSVTYADADGVTQTLPTADYVLDNLADDGEVWLLPAPGVTWPAHFAGANALRVRYQAGYATVPDAIRAWMLMAVSTWHKQREQVASGTMAELPRAFWDGLLDPYRIWRL